MAKEKTLTSSSGIQGVNTSITVSKLLTSANILISSVHMVSVINENNKLLVHQLHK